MHELMIPRRIMQPSIARDSELRTTGPAMQHDRYTTTPISHYRPHPVARKGKTSICIARLVDTSNALSVTETKPPGRF